MQKRGLTLIELILVVTLFSLFIEGMILAFSTSQRLWWREGGRKNRQQLATILLERICSDIRNASVLQPASSTGEVFLSVENEVVRYCLVNQKVRKVVGSNVSYLSNEEEVWQLCFQYPAEKLVEIRINNLINKVALRN